jgi:hypothetical protein
MLRWIRVTALCYQTWEHMSNQWEQYQVDRAERQGGITFTSQL